MIRRPVLFLGLLVSFSRLAVTAEPRVHYIRYLPRASSADDCSQASFHNLSWSVTNLTFHSSIIFSTPAHQIDGATVTFNLTNTATGSDFRMKCDGRSEQLQQFFFGDIWYRCDIINANSSTEAASKSFDREAAQFRFSRPTGELVLNQAWTCRDHDPKYPYVSHPYKLRYWGGRNWAGEAREDAERTREQSMLTTSTGSASTPRAPLTRRSLATPQDGRIATGLWAPFTLVRQ